MKRFLIKEDTLYKTSSGVVLIEIVHQDLDDIYIVSGVYITPNYGYRTWTKTGIYDIKDSDSAHDIIEEIGPKEDYPEMFL